MRDHATLTEEDEGKAVVNAAGDTVGRVTAVENEQAHVDPDSGVTDAIRSKLGWGDDDGGDDDGGDDGGDDVLDASDIESISDDAIHLSK